MLSASSDRLLEKRFRGLAKLEASEKSGDNRAIAGAIAGRSQAFEPALQRAGLTF